MKTVRAKFAVSEVTNHGGGSMSFKLAPVYSSDPNHENKAFWDATPSGSLSLYITNKPAAEFFEVGKEYYLDFTLAE